MAQAELHAALRTQDVKQVELLLERKDVDPSKANADGDTPLHEAVYAGSPACVDKLLAAGADPTVTNLSGDSLLHEAVRAQNYHMVLSFLKAGGNPNAFNKAGDTSLHEAVRTQHLKLVSALLSAGADATLSSASGDTPILEALRGRNESLFALLFADGTTINVPSASGDTLLALSLQAQNWGAVATLCRGGLYDATLDDPEKKVDDLMAVLGSPIAAEDPGAVEHTLASPILTAGGVSRVLMSDGRFEALQEVCRGHLVKIQSELEATYAAEKLGESVLGSIENVGGGAAAAAGADAAAAAGEPRQDAEGCLPTLAGTGLTEDGLAHVLHLLSVSLDTRFHGGMRAVFEASAGVVAVLESDEAGNATGSGDGKPIMYIPGTPKEVAAMLGAMKAGGCHEEKQRPRPACNVDCLNCTVAYSSLAAMRAGFEALRARFDVLQVRNGYAPSVDPAATFGDRAIVVNFVFSVEGVTFKVVAAENTAPPCDVKNTAPPCDVKNTEWAWDKHVKSITKDRRQRGQKAHVSHAMKYLRHVGHEDRVVCLVAEAVLLYRPYHQARDRASMFGAIVRAPNARDASLAFMTPSARAARKVRRDSSITIQAAARGRAVRRIKLRRAKMKLRAARVMGGVSE